MENPAEAPWLRDLGAATQLTRGSAYLWPWFETAAPPYDRICEVCYKEDERLP